MKKKKWIIIVIIIAAAAVAAWFGLNKAGVLGGGSSKGVVYVEAVSDLNGGTKSGLENRYAGIVETQKEWTVDPESGQAVKEVYVKEGDVVEVGQKLFSYDMDSIKLAKAQAQLELEQMQNEVTETNKQINDLQKEMQHASKTDKYELTLQVNQLQTTLKQDNYKIEGKKEEIAELEKSMENTDVVSEIDGVVKSVKEIQDNSDNAGYDDWGMESSENSFITILASDSYRVKGMINETNIGSLMEGMPAIIRSRVDDTAIWSGTIDTIETEQSENNGQNEYYGESGNEMYGSSNYPFYVVLDSNDGLMLGQHVYIELNDGQEEVKEGIWLYSGYITMDTASEPSDDGSVVAEESFATGFVWADNGNGHLEKREVELGAYDPNLDMYQIVSGLELTDYIAWPMENLSVGMKTTTNMEEAMVDDGSGDSFDEYSEFGEESFESIDEGFDYVDEGTIDEEYSEDMLDEDMMDEDMPIDDMMLDDEGEGEVLDEGEQ